MSLLNDICSLTNNATFEVKIFLELLNYNLSNLQKNVETQKQTWTTVEVLAEQYNANNKVFQLSKCCNIQV